MSDEPNGCPECHYVWYKYYEEIEIAQMGEEEPLYEAMEMPVAIRTPRGYLCRLCRHEWKEDGTPVDQETIEQNITSFRKHGKEAQAEIRGLKGKVNNK